MAKLTSIILLVLAMLAGAQQHVLAQDARRPSEEEVQKRAEQIRREEAEKKAYEDRKKLDDEATRRARKELERELERSAERALKEVDEIRKAEAEESRNARKAEQRAFRARHASGLVCSSQEDFDNTWVDYNSALRSFGWVHSAFLIVNRGNTPIMIKQTAGIGVTAGRIVVRNLCPGGSLTLLQRIGASDMTQVSYVALEEDGGEVVSISPMVYLTPCWGRVCQQEFPAVWTIK